MTDDKKSNGLYFTHGNPFRNRPFSQWARIVGLPGKHILEPFAGSNNLITMLTEMGLCNWSSSYIDAITRRRQTTLGHSW